VFAVPSVATPDPYSHYVIVRRDLPRGLLAAQVVHAAGESSPGGIPEGTHAVVLAADDLGPVRDRLVAEGLPHVEVAEEGLGLVALGVAPGPKSKFRSLGDLPLLR